MLHKINLILLFSLILSALSCTKTNNNAKPNIVLVCVDDMGWSDIGCYGSEINTPNIDRLANGGMRFRKFYNTSKCFPSRACLLTGVYAQDCGYSENSDDILRNAVTLGEVLQSAGYLTYWSGKHHGLENPYDRGFNHYFGLKDGACNHFNPGKQREGEPAPAQKRPNRQWAIDSARYSPYTPDKDFYTTDRFTDYALSYIDEAAQKQQPFFLYLAITAPHDPLMAWPEDIAKYKGKYDEGYEFIRQKRYNKQLDLGLINTKFRLSEPAYQPWDSLSIEEKAFEASKMEVYAAMIDRIDQNLGRVLQKLQDHKLDENSLILFVSDNGASAEMVNLKNDDDTSPVGSMARWISLGEDWANVSNTPYVLYKNYSFEGGIKTPCIAFWPGKIKENSFTDFPGHFIDFMATFVDVSNAEYPKIFNGMPITPMRGESLIPVFKGKKATRNQALFWEWRNGRAVQKDKWKIVKNGINTPWELYNLENDPTETINLANTHPEKVKELNDLFDEWFAKK